MSRTVPIVVASALALVAGALPAHASSLYRDQVQADSFGNLVVYSPAGYKRIVVGAGELAAELRAFGGGEPLDGERTFYGPDRECNRYGVLLKGRSYMYGLPERVVPAPAGFCD